MVLKWLWMSRQAHRVPEPRRHERSYYDRRRRYTRRSDANEWTTEQCRSSIGKVKPMVGYAQLFDLALASLLCFNRLE
jgi:hypothetical protein